MRIKEIMFLVLLLCLFGVKASGQEDESRRWAIDFNLTPVKPVVSVNETPKEYYDPVKSGGGPNFSFHLEYFIPKSKFSVVGGYERERMDFYSGEVSADLSQLMLGGRWYIMPESSLFQPYLGANTYWNIDERRQSGSINALAYDYVRDYNVKSPLLSMAPVVGVDIYLFSSLALEVGYEFRFAINGHTSSETTFGNEQTSYAMRSPMHRHALSVGLKLTFPLKFTSNDFNGLLDTLFTILNQE